MAKINELILYSDNQIIALNKPAGMPTQEDQSGDASLHRITQAYCKHDIYIIHRLDRPTSGIVVFAKTRAAAAHLSKQWKDRTVQKKYLAVVPKGLPVSGNLKHQLVPGKGSARTQVVLDGTGQEASLDYSLVGEIDHFVLAEVRPETGRRHQIRAQFAAAGYPVRGDDKYGAKRGNRDRSIQLHAHQLQFQHPTKGEQVSLVCPLPESAVWTAFDYS